MQQPAMYRQQQLQRAAVWVGSTTLHILTVARHQTAVTSNREGLALWRESASGTVCGALKSLSVDDQDARRAWPACVPSPCLMVMMK